MNIYYTYSKAKQIYLKTKPVYRFFLNGIFVYLLWIIFYEIVRYTSTIDYIYNSAAMFLTNILLYVSKFVLDVLGYESYVFTEIRVIQLEGTRGVFLDRGCLGRNLIGLFAGFIIVYPGKIKSKLWYIPLGVLIICIINVLRIVGLSFVLLYFPKYIDINHHVVFKYTIYGFILLMWFFWIRRYGVKN